MKISTFAQRLRAGLDVRGMSQTELAARSKISKSSISHYLKGDWEGKQDAVYSLAQVLDVSEAWLMGYDVPMERGNEQEKKSGEYIPQGFQSLPEMSQVPLVGCIACGVPILAEENIKKYIGVPAEWRADFALECHGDSMAPKICDGDIVCIRKQPMVETGQIAAVRIGEEATLKHFHKKGNTVMLLAENSAVCPPMVFSEHELDEMSIEGLAVGFCRGLL